MEQPSDAHPAPRQEKIWAHFQNAFLESFDAARPRLEFLAQRIARYAATPRPRVLNIGVGSGYFEQLCHARGWEVHALDPDERALARLREKGVEVHVGYIEKLPFAANAVDFVVASEVIEHLDESQRRAGLAEIARVLTPRGWFLGTTPYNEDLKLGITVCPCCGAQFHRWGHQASFTLETLAAELTPWFRPVELRRTAFVEFRGRSILGKLRAAVRVLLAKQGQAIAAPTIYWASQKNREV